MSDVRSDSQWQEALQNDADPALQRLGDGLRASHSRGTDEILQRRVWSRVASPPPQRESGRRTGALALLLSTTAIAAGVFWFVGQPVVEPAPIAISPSRMAPIAADVEAKVEKPAAPLVVSESLRTGPGERLGIHLSNGARVDLSPETRFNVRAEAAPELQTGRIGLQVPPQHPDAPFVVMAGPYRVRVVGTRFSIEMNAKQVSVGVTEGVVEVEREGRVVRLRAGQSWSGSIAEPRRPTVAVTPTPVEFGEQARKALAAGEVNEALRLLSLLSRKDDPAAENAVYESARLVRDRLKQPREAVRIWRSYRTRFPNGMLRAEVDLNIVETLAQLGSRDRALVEAEDFLQRHPDSERRMEVEALAKALRGGSAIEAR
jgi:FecR protein